jgi:Protein of unknown function (DUF3617)
MYTLIGFSLISLLAAGTPTGPIMPAESDAIHDWPAVKQGVWVIEGTMTQKGKKKKWKSTTRHCDDPSTLFQGYWGRGKADKNDCLFQSTKVSGSKYEIVGECLVEQNDVVKSESVVIMKGQESFEMDVKFQQGKTGAKAKETGHWVSACRESEKSAATPAPGASNATAATTPSPTATAKAEPEAATAP